MQGKLDVDSQTDRQTGRAGAAQAVKGMDTCGLKPAQRGQAGPGCRGSSHSHGQSHGHGRGHGHAPLTQNLQHSSFACRCFSVSSPGTTPLMPTLSCGGRGSRGRVEAGAGAVEAGLRRKQGQRSDLVLPLHCLRGCGHAVYVYAMCVYAQLYKP
jgi:hypothetical protein